MSPRLGEVGRTYAVHPHQLLAPR